MASVAISRLFRRTFRSSFGITRAASTPSGSVSHNGTHANAYVESRSEQSLREHSLWRVSNSPFVEVPQAWVTTFDTHDERRIGLLELHPDIFRVSPRLDILHKNLTWQQVYRNVQLTKMLSKAEMPGGGRKPWPQKKTGRAHVGSVRSPQFIRGGFAHGARGPRSWFYMLPDSVRIQGLCIALTIKHVQDDLHIVDTLDTLSDGDPQYLMDLAENRNWGYSVLFVNDTDEISGGLAEASLALPSFTVMPYYGLNCFSLLKYDTIVFSRNALELVQSRLLHGLHRAESLNKKYRYADFKEKILAEGKAEEHSTQPPPV